jgi:hypothetical protein
MNGRVTRSKTEADKSKPSSLQRIFADENESAHPNKRINLASSAEFQISKETLVKNIIETKKLNISENEMNMNGAPAGDLYDVQVLSDLELISFESQDMAVSAFETACALKKESLSASWADLFSVVEVIRRIAVHHPDILLSSEFLQITVDAAVEASSSLRSSTIRYLDYYY